ncbi:MAG: hypothetical protein IKB04_01125 [Clostridia bacterium]|nr:hypothetical protein [Clostridia bacterium]
MRCFNCGYETTEYLCPDCRTAEILDKVFSQIRFYKAETCDNPYLAEYVSGLTEKYAERNAIPAILDCFDVETNEFYYCQYYRMRKDDRFESAALSYLATHSLDETKTQRVLYDLIDNYIPNDFVKPKKWCEIVAEKDDLCCELYLVAAKYFSMIGEYDVSDAIAKRAISACGSGNAKLLFYSLEGIVPKLYKQQEDTQRYRTKIPYWPNTEDRRRAVAMFYDERGISYRRIESKPEKTPENEFTPPTACYDAPDSYCAFWCAAAFSVAQSKPIYQIAAVKVENGKRMDSFQEYIRPWDGETGRKSAAKEADVDLTVIDSARDVDQVMVDFLISLVMRYCYQPMHWVDK